MLNRRSILKAGAATMAVATPAAAAMADDAPLFDLLAQLDNARRAALAANAREQEAIRSAPVDVMRIRWWTKDELIAYRIDGKKEPRFVSLDDLKKNAEWSHPGYSIMTVEVAQDDSEAFSQLMKRTYPKYTTEDLDAWKRLCADREALYHAKEQAYDDARRVYGYDDALEAVDKAWTEFGRIYALVVDMPASTVAGALAKLKLFMVEEELIDPETPPDQLSGNERLFLSALDALERIGGAAMTTNRRAILGAALTAGAGIPVYELLATGRTEAAQAERWEALHAAFNGPHVDAELLELGRQREAVISTIDGDRSLSDEDASRLGDEWLALDHRIMNATPQTAAGLAVQLAVIWRDIGTLPGEENGPTENTSRAMRWLWQATQNARRIGGAQ